MSGGEREKSSSNNGEGLETIATRSENKLQII